MQPVGGARIFLILSLFFSIPLLAQVQLRIVTIQGEGVLNNTGGRANRDVVVEVQDIENQPVSGAQVSFILPAEGASGTFANGERTLSVTTNEQGRATPSGIRPNSQTGPMEIRVTATYLDQTATAVISQTNVAVVVPDEPKPSSVSTSQGGQPTPPKSGLSTTAKVLLILGIAGGAAAGAAIAIGGNGSSPGGGGGGPGGPPIVITPGTPSVGGPQ